VIAKNVESHSKTKTIGERVDMAYNVLDVTNKDLGAGPSINGMRELRQTLAANNEHNFPALNHLLTFGYTTKLSRMIVDCRTLIKRTTNVDVKSTLQSFVQQASKANEMLILEA
jgi:hypothetical protein